MVQLQWYSSNSRWRCSQTPASDKRHLTTVTSIKEATIIMPPSTRAAIRKPNRTMLLNRRETNTAIVDTA